MSLTDDEAITLAAMTGCEFWYNGALWYPSKTKVDSPYLEYMEWRSKNSSLNGCRSRTELAHEWCKFFKLGEQV